MKIAIQGHPTRGKEVIQILESLGGRNAFNYNGDYIRTAYFIGMDYSIYGFCTCSPKVGFKVYTLEEFEKEFPFKVGDEVTIIGSPDFPKIITKIAWDCNEILYSFEGLVNTWFGAKSLKKFEMKKERNVTLTLDKAKEWYKKGGELKEVALQAYSEKELNPCIEYVDLGLPSGTLWADTNEEGYYSYQDAIDTFGKNNLPKLTDFAELYDYCKWEWCDESKSMIVTGPNGKYIKLPASGSHYSSNGDLYGVGNYGYYWSASPSSYSAYFLYFYKNGYINPSLSNHCADGCAVRKIKRK